MKIFRYIRNFYYTIKYRKETKKYLREHDYSNFEGYMNPPRI